MEMNTGEDALYGGLATEIESADMEPSGDTEAAIRLAWELHYASQQLNGSRFNALERLNLDKCAIELIREAIRNGIVSLDAASLRMLREEELMLDETSRIMAVIEETRNMTRDERKACLCDSLRPDDYFTVFACLRMEKRMERGLMQADTTVRKIISGFLDRAVAFKVAHS